MEVKQQQQQQPITSTGTIIGFFRQIDRYIHTYLLPFCWEKGFPWWKEIVKPEFSKMFFITETK